MKLIITIFLLFLCSGNRTFGQKSLFTGKTFVNDSLDQIEFRNDSVLVASFTSFPQKYEFKDRYLLLTPLHHQDMKLKDSYEVTYLSPDTLRLVDTSRFKIRADTMQFININKRYIKLKDFDSLRVDVYGFSGSKRLIIRKNKTVKFGHDDRTLPDEEFPEYRYFTLSNSKYNELLDTLSKSLIFMLPFKRAEGGYDPTYVNFTIHTNQKTILSNGVTLSPIHWRLFKYLFTNIVSSK